MNRPFFLTEQTLNKLIEDDKRIRILRLDIKEWHQSLLNQPQLFSPHWLDQMKFEQINLTIPCYSHPRQLKLVQWNLFKYLERQDRSPCPTQIRFQNEDFDLNRYEYPPVYPPHQYFQFVSNSSLSTSSTQSNRINKFPSTLVLQVFQIDFPFVLFFIEVFLLKIFIPMIILLLIGIYSFYRCRR